MDMLEKYPDSEPIAKVIQDKERHACSVMMIDKNKTPFLNDSKPRKNEREETSIMENDLTTLELDDINVPLHKRYDLAIKMNEARFRHTQKEGYKIEKISCKERYKLQNERSADEKKADEAKKRDEDLIIAYYVTQINIRVLKLLEQDNIDEEALAKNFKRFMRCFLTSESLLYVPHFVHALKFCRSFKNLSRPLRSLADDCFQKCHVMFPVPLGNSFENVYFEAVKNAVPMTYEQMHNVPLEYDDFSESESESEAPE